MKTTCLGKEWIKMVVDYTKKEIMGEFVKKRLVDILTAKPIDEKLKEVKDEIHKITIDEKDKEKLNDKLFEIRQDTFEWKEKLKLKYDYCLDGVLKKDDSMEKIHTKVISSVLEETLEHFGADFDILRKRMKIDGRSNSNLNKDKFNTVYRKFLCEAIGDEKELLNLFRRNWSEDTGDWFFSYSTSVELLVALAEYCMLYNGIIGLNEEEKEKLKREYEKYPAVLHMIDNKPIYRWEYQYLLKEILNDAKEENIDYYNKNKKIRENYKKCCEYLDRSVVLDNNGFLTGVYGLQDGVENIKKLFNLIIQKDKYTSVNLAKIRKSINEMIKKMKKVDKSLESIIKENEKENFFMPEIYDARDSIEKIEKYIEHIVIINRYFNSDKRLYCKGNDMLTNFVEDLNNLVSKNMRKLEQVEEEAAVKLIEENCDIIEKFKEKILNDESIEISKDFLRIVCNCLVKEHNDINNIMEAVNLGDDLKYSTLKNNFMKKDIIKEDYEWRSLIKRSIESRDKSVAKYIVDVVKEY